MATSVQKSGNHKYKDNNGNISDNHNINDQIPMLAQITRQSTTPMV